MLYSGPSFEPTTGNITIWKWLFESSDRKVSRSTGFWESATGSFISHHNLKLAAESLSSTLIHGYTLRPHQTVAVVARNSTNYVTAVLAASRSGATVTLLPPVASSEDLSYMLEASSTSLIFTDEELLPKIREACRLVGWPNTFIVLLDSSTDGAPDIESLTKKGSPHGYENAFTSRTVMNSQKIPPAFLSFTSGTTGKPKAVIISHNNVINQLRQVHEFSPPQSSRRAVLGILPFYHITGLVHLIHLPIATSHDLVVMGQFDVKSMMETIVNFRCTELWLVPPLLIRLLNDKAAQGYDLSHVEQFNTGAAPLTEQIISKLADRFPNVRLRQSWGMTETTSCLTITPPALMTWQNASKVGCLVPGTSIRIVDPHTGKDVPAGGVGEIWAKGPQVTKGYLNRPEATSSTYVDGGFILTGDLGSIGASGFIVIHDRIKEMIKVRGHAVAPAELEDLLLGLPFVADAAVIGVADEYSGEIPRAFVVLKEGTTSSVESLRREINSLVEAKKPRYKRLSGGIDFVKGIPKSPSGKILRRLLKDQWLASVKSEAGRGPKL